MKKRLPIAAAKALAQKYDLSQVIIVAWEKEESRTHVVTYGTTLADCEQAAQGGNFVKRALGFPDLMCSVMPARVRRKRRKAALASRSG